MHAQSSPGQAKLTEFNDDNHDVCLGQAKGKEATVVAGGGGGGRQRAAERPTGGTREEGCRDDRKRKALQVISGIHLYG